MPNYLDRGLKTKVRRAGELEFTSAEWSGYRFVFNKPIKFICLLTCELSYWEDGPYFHSERILVREDEYEKDWVGRTSSGLTVDSFDINYQDNDSSGEWAGECVSQKVGAHCYSELFWSSKDNIPEYLVDKLGYIEWNEKLDRLINPSLQSNGVLRFEYSP